MEESPSSGLSFHLVSRPQSFEEDRDEEPIDVADVAVFGGRESLRRRSRRHTLREHEERADRARRALFEERLHAVENRERQMLGERDRMQSQEHGGGSSRRSYSYVSDNIRELIIRDKLDCGYTCKEIGNRYNIPHSTVAKIVTNFQKTGLKATQVHS